MVQNIIFVSIFTIVVSIHVLSFVWVESIVSHLKIISIFIFSSVSQSVLQVPIEYTRYQKTIFYSNIQTDVSWAFGDNWENSFLFYIILEFICRVFLMLLGVKIVASRNCLIMFYFFVEKSFFPLQLNQIVSDRRLFAFIQCDKMITKDKTFNTLLLLDDTKYLLVCQ